MCRWAFISLCFIAHYEVCRGQDKVEQPIREITEGEGAHVFVQCNYTSSNPTLFWYKQLPNRSPTLILSQYSAEADKKRFSATLNSKEKSFPLLIQDLQVSDSAVYYCALEPTVKGNTTTLNKNLTHRI
uniref:IgV_TCR_alpha and Ig domain-containing protein precursor n=1 Tax=Danio rerio TaxID=7955 RepID=UPI004041EAE1